MQSLRTKKSHKGIIIAAIILAVLVAGTLFYFFVFANKSTDEASSENTTSSSSNDTPESTDSTSSGTKTQDPSDTSTTSNTTKNSNGLSSSSTSSATDTPKTVAVTVSSFVDNGSSVRVGVDVDTLSSGGTCKLTMSGPGGKTYSASAGVQSLASSSVCKGFTVPKSSLSSGTWTVTVNYSGSNESGSVSQKEQVQI